MRRVVKKYLIIIVAILAIIFLLQQINWLPSFGKIFGSKPVTIDNTPILIKEINELAQLSTITSYDEVVVDSARVSTNPLSIRGIADITMNPLLPPIDRLVLVARGKVVAGSDLRQLNDSSFYFKKDSVSLTIPRAVILDAIINPSEFETFIEKGTWEANAVTRVKIKAREKMIARAISRQILEKANARSKLIMENFLKSAGYEKVSVQTN